MAILNDFEYYKPDSIDDALSLLEKYGKKAKILAGGTDLIVHLKENLIKPEVIIDIKGIENLNQIKESDDEIFIGSLVTFTELMESDMIKENFPALWQSASKVASVGIRNRATLTGNICSAVPSLDSAPALLIYDAKILVKSLKEEREISIHDWFIAPRKTALKSDEIVIGIKITQLLKKHYGNYEKLGRYEGEDLAQAGIGILAKSPNLFNLAFCAVGPIPKRMRKVENFLKGKDVTDKLIEEAANLIEFEISPIDDIRSSARYRTHMMKVMFKREMMKAIKHLEEV